MAPRYRETISATPPHPALCGLGVSAFPLACALEVRYPQCRRGISAILAQYSMTTRQNACDTPSAIRSQIVGDGPNALSESAVSNAGLSELFRSSPSSGELSEFLAAYCLCAKANSPSFSQNSPILLQNQARSRVYRKQASLANFGEPTTPYS